MDQLCRTLLTTDRINFIMSLRITTVRVFEGHFVREKLQRSDFEWYNWLLSNVRLKSDRKYFSVYNRLRTC